MEYRRGMDEEPVTAGKRRNPILTWLVWALITLGIYYFVWWYKINREARDSGVEVKPGRDGCAYRVAYHRAALHLHLPDR